MIKNINKNYCKIANLFKMKLNVRIKPRNLNEKKACEFIILKAIKNNIKSARDILLLQKLACEKYKIGFVTHPMLLATYRDLVKSKKIKLNSLLFQLLRKRRVRTSSGIAAVAVLTKPYSCPGKCIYCPDEKGMPKSYLSNEPAVMRANMVGFDPIKQVFVRLRGLEIAGNSAEKIELIVMGGTFSYLPRVYQIQFIINCYWACNNYFSNFQFSTPVVETNGFTTGQVSNFQSNPKFKKLKQKIKSKNINILQNILEQEQRKNEKAKYRIVGLTLETRPDYIDENEIIWFRKLGCTRVEIGVQSIYDRVLDINNRGHKVSETIQATKLLKDAGFKVCYHMMPNLYGSNRKLDLQMFKDLFSKQELQPDLLKIYPCVLTANSELNKIFRQKKFIPYTDAELIKLLINIKQTLPEYVRVQRLYRDIPAESILAGSKISNIRQILKMNYESGIINQERKLLCKCIRCREIREDEKLPVKLKRIDYDASDGKEIFLQYVDKNNRIYALLRLRITSSNYAMIREVHTYGQVVQVGDKNKKDSQHRGLGKKLIYEAEQIAKEEFSMKEIAVISGIGVRDYYRKLGYQLYNTYMIKKL